MIYKQRTYLSLNSGGDNQYTGPVAVNHQQCRLGKWYLGEGKDLFGSLASYRSLDVPHARVHNGAHRVLGEIQHDWQNEPAVQMAIIEGLDEMESGSRDVMALLDRMVIEKHPA
jgi:hypothetical protein